MLVRIPTVDILLSWDSTTSAFTIPAGYEKEFEVGDAVQVVGVSLCPCYYIQPVSTDQSIFNKVRLTEDAAGEVNAFNYSRYIRVSKIVIVDHPRRPRLVDPGAQSISPTTTPTVHRTWTISEPRFEGSVIFDIHRREDVRYGDAFIDALSNPDAYFELEPPEPERHFGAVDVFEAQTNWDDGWIVLANSTGQSVPLLGKVGWLARVGNRSVRVVEWSARWYSVPAGGEGGGNVNLRHDAIKIEPASQLDVLRNMTTPAFSSFRSIRARPLSIEAVGDPDYGSSGWRVDWVETDG